MKIPTTLSEDAGYWIIVVILAVMMLSPAVITFYDINRTNTLNQQCAARGGQYVKTQSGYECAKLEILK